MAHKGGSGTARLGVPLEKTGSIDFIQKNGSYITGIKGDQILIGDMVL